jgi:hypothetical protein
MASEIDLADDNKCEQSTNSFQITDAIAVSNAEINL